MSIEINPVIAGTIFGKPHSHFCGSVLFRKVSGKWSVLLGRVVQKPHTFKRGVIVEVPEHAQKWKCPGGSSKSKVNPTPVTTWLEERAEELQIPLPSQDSDDLVGILVHREEKPGDGGREMHVQYFFLDMWTGDVRLGEFVDLDQDKTILEWVPVADLVTLVRNRKVRPSHLRAILAGGDELAFRDADFGIIMWAKVSEDLRQESLGLK